MENRQKYALFALFIIAIMLFSSIAVISSFSPEGNNFPDNETPSQGTQISFSASEVDANVLEAFNSITLSGTTSETNINKIDSEIYALGNVDSIQSQFVQGSSSEIVYFAQISFSDSNAVSFLEKVSQNVSSLSNIDAYSLALLQVPSSIEVSNPSLELSKTFFPENSLVQAFTTPKTQKGDFLKISLQVTYIGETPAQVLAFEQTNLSRQAIPVAVVLEARVISKKPLLTISGEMPYKSILSSQQLSEKVNSFENVKSSSFQVGSFEKRVVFDILKDLSDNEVTILQEAIQSSGISEISSFTFTSKLTGVKVNTYFDDSNSLIDLPHLEEKVLNVFSDLGIPEDKVSISEPSASFIGTIDLNSEKSGSTYISLQNFFNKKKISYSIFQDSNIFVDKIIDPFTSAYYYVDNNSVRAFIKPSSKIGDTVKVRVDATVDEEKIVSIGAIEVE